MSPSSASSERAWSRDGDSYGSGVAPFFTNLALWVAGFILMAMVKLRVDPEGLPEFTAVQAYFGRWLFYVVCGMSYK